MCSCRQGKNLSTDSSGVEKPHLHTGGKYDQDMIDELSMRFADALAPALDGDLISMAALQAYLLTRKDDPHKAVAEAAEWAEELVKKADEQDEAKKEKEEKERKEEDAKKKEEEDMKKKEEEEGEKTDAGPTDEKPVLAVNMTDTTDTTTAGEEGYDTVNAEDVVPSSPS